MYAGRVVEYTDVFTLFNSPGHPYTEGLLRSLPRVGSKQNKLDTIEGQPPMLNQLPPGCAFTPRCKYAKEKCKNVPPELVSIGKGHEVRCYFPILGEQQ
jgi:oligopeptide/dipeptide ABC transporter ATP-binding protein